jgi:phosphoribosyl-ATP pyrophosphohydrolase/phosphoribosyl-AMP cyclohydrolase
MLFGNSLNLKFDKRGLIPAIIQHAETKKVLMYVFMNKEAIKKTKKTGELWLYHRHLKKTWKKGNRTGNTMRVEDMILHHDRNVLLVQVIPKGPACHTGNETCFYENLSKKIRKETEEVAADADDGLEMLRKLFGGEGEIEIGGEKESEDLSEVLQEIEEETEEGVEEVSAAENVPGAAAEKTVIQEEGETPRPQFWQKPDFLESYYKKLGSSKKTLEKGGRKEAANRMIRDIGTATTGLAMAIASGDKRVLLKEGTELVHRLLLLLAMHDVPFEMIRKELEATVNEY